MKRLSVLVAGVIFSATIFAGAYSAYAESPTVQPNSQTIQQMLASQKTSQSTPAKQDPEPKMVTVQPGDYLAKIADENQTTYPRVFDANPNIQDPDIIHPGDNVRIPEPNEQLASRPLPENASQVASASQTAAPRQNYAAAPSPVTPSDGSVWDQLAACESGGRWNANTGNGYYGGLQFTASTWHGVGGSGLPSEASREEQIARAETLQARSGWGQWPACSAKLGLR